MDRRTVLYGAGAALLAIPAWAKGLAAPIIVSRAGLVFLTVTANGRDIKALVDTGSVRGVQLSEEIAKALSLSLAETGQSTQRYQGGARPVMGARLASLTVAGKGFRDVQASVSPGDIETIGQQIGETFDAILGWPLLSAQPFVVDYRAGSLDFRPEEAKGGLSLPLEPGRPLPVTAGSVAGQPVTFLVDTGAPWCNIDPTLAGGAAAGSRIDLPFTAGGRALSATFRVKDLSAMTRGLGAKAVLGHRFLQGYRLSWDPEAKAIRLFA